MSAKTAFLATMGWLLLLAAGFVAAAAMVNPQEVIERATGFVLIGESSHWWRWLITGGSALLILFTLILPFTGRGRGRRDKPIEFTSEVGSMIIEASALEDCLRRTALEDEDVTDATANIRVPEIGQDQPIVCSVRIGIRERPNIPGKAGEIAKKIRERFLEILPMDTPPIVNLDRISIQRPKPTVTRTFTKIAGEQTQVPSEDDLPELPHGVDESKKNDQPAARAGFTGVMQYPVETDDKQDSEDEEKRK